MNEKRNSVVRDVVEKIRQYSVTDIFTYTGVSKVRIITQLCRYIFLKTLQISNVTANVNGYKMKLDLSTPGLSKVLFVYGTRELPDTYLIQQILKEGMVVADIGANIGYYTLLEARAVGAAGHVHAFEPDPRNLPLLADNIALNKYADRVTIVPKAVSDKRETKRFLLGERSNVSSFVERPDVVGDAQVDCIPLPEYHAIDEIDFIRMDAEGYECHILRGLVPYLTENDREFTIMLEVHPFEYNDTDLNFIAVLEKLFNLGFYASHVIAGTHEKELYEELGYASVGHWIETRHGRELYHNVADEDVIDFIRAKKMRALVLKRDTSDRAEVEEKND